MKGCNEFEATVPPPRPQKPLKVCSSFKAVTETEGNEADGYQPFDGHWCFVPLLLIKITHLYVGFVIRDFEDLVSATAISVVQLL